MHPNLLLCSMSSGNIGTDSGNARRQNIRHRLWLANHITVQARYAVFTLTVCSPLLRFFAMSSGMYLGSKLTSSDVIYNCLPLYHSAGGILALGCMLLRGNTFVLRSKFSAKHFFEDCIKYKCTVRSHRAYYPTGCDVWYSYLPPTSSVFPRWYSTLGRYVAIS